MIIFTPTYNRADTLNNLYQSLLAQTNKDFIWLIVDDGSTDNTAQLVEKWQFKSSFKIKYIYQKNQGKHIAYNTAINTMPNDEVHIVVDSDDTLTENAIETFYNDLQNSDDYIGIVYPKFYKNQNTTQWINSNIQKVNIPDIKHLYELSIETCIVIKNEYIEDFRFPQFANEKYISEEMFYIFLQKKGFFKPLFRKLYIFEYLQQGMTNNTFILWQKNMMGTLYFLNERKEYITRQLTGFKKYTELFKVKLNINALKLCNKTNKLDAYCFIDYILLPFSIVWKKYRFKNKGEINE